MTFWSQNGLKTGLRPFWSQKWSRDLVSSLSAVVVLVVESVVVVVVKTVVVVAIAAVVVVVSAQFGTEHSSHLSFGSVV